MIALKPAIQIGGIAAAVLLGLSCTPSLYPLYRDYEDTGATEAVGWRIERALEASGWTLTAAAADNVIATRERSVRRWGVYSIVASLEAIPIGGGYVRVLVHPYRQYLWGARSKLPFLNGTIRRSLLREVDIAMRKQNLTAIGTGVSRDRENTR